MTARPADNPLLHAALDYAARGIPVLPVHCPILRPGRETACSCGDVSCGSIGKHPITAHGLNDASTNREQLEWWWRRFPRANIGLATGHVFDVLDVDGHVGERSVNQVLAAEHAVGPPPGPVVRTGRGGWHLYMAPTGLGNPKPRGLEKVDWRGRGGYVVAPPSRHATGRRYRWVRDLDTPIPEVPAALRERLEWPAPAQPAARPTVRPLTPGHPYGQRALEARLAEVARAPKGERNHTLYTAGLRLFSLVAGGVLDRAQVEAGLLTAAERSGLLRDEPMQTRNTIRSAESVAKDHPAGVPVRDRPPRRPTASRHVAERRSGWGERERDG
jgi:Bifunctional DNA primase/polymerase, N-terminal